MVCDERFVPEDKGRDEKAPPLRLIRPVELGVRSAPIGVRE